MKYLLILFLPICLKVSAQNASSITKSISDDDKTLTLIYEHDSNKKHIRYNNSFDVRGLTKDEKETLVDNIIDSLNNAPSSANKSITTDRVVTINDDGNKLSVTVDANSKKHNIHISRTFDVAGKTQKEKDTIVEKFLESLGLKDGED